MLARSLMKVLPLLSAVIVISVTGRAEAIPAFPGAEGFGARATGGRGGQVLKVTTLDANGPGSLQWALDQPGPRVIVFEVSGVIEADIIEIPHGDVTIAGQTAPGAGITLQARLYAAYDASVGNMIIRHLRIRPPALTGDGNQFDGIQFSRNFDLIFDHVSVSYGVDETIDLYESNSVTIQWSTISMGATEGHPEGLHNYGMIVGPDGTRTSVHHNLFVHQRNRNPALATGPVETRNNVVHDVRHGYVHHNPASGPHAIVGNYYRRGPEDELFPFFFDDAEGADLAYYLADNYIDDPAEFVGVVDNPWQEPWVHPSFEYLSKPESLRVEQDFDFTTYDSEYVPVTMTDSQTAYDEVLTYAGAFPRDVVDETIVMQTEAGEGGWGVWRPDDLLDGLTPGEPPLDSDGDGMPDPWELEHGLDPANGSDHTTVMESGYTAIEDYINGLSDAITGQEPPGGDDGGGDDTGGSDDGGGDGTAGDGGSSAGDAGPGGDGGGGSDGGGASGTDGAAEGGDSADAAEGESDGGGCGCRNTPTPWGAAWLMVLVCALRRRRSPALR